MKSKTTTWTCTFTKRPASEIVKSFQDKLNHTPKWKIFKRFGLKRRIKVWSEIMEKEAKNEN